MAPATALVRITVREKIAAAIKQKMRDQADEREALKKEYAELRQEQLALQQALQTLQ